MTFFPLPDEFYADPTFATATDAEIALYSRAGSWSVHHRTDGFVPAAILPQLYQLDDSAARALVRRGVWRRARGGFQYAVWPRQITRAYLEAQQEANRRRQANHRRSKQELSHRD